MGRRNPSTRLLRRSFLVRLATAGATLLAVVRKTGFTMAGEASPALGQLSARDFERLEDRRFRILEDDGTRVEFLLAEVRKAPADPGRPKDGLRNEPFSLLFRPTVPVVLRQEVREVVHAKLGRMRLLLVPVGPFPDVARYEAIFN